MPILSTDESAPPQSSPVGRWRFCINQTIRNREAQSSPSLQQYMPTVPGLNLLSSKCLLAAPLFRPGRWGCKIYTVSLSCFHGKDPDAGKDRRQKEKGAAEDEMIR